jgi:hypothetical protein
LGPLEGKNFPWPAPSIGQNGKETPLHFKTLNDGNKSNFQNVTSKKARQWTILIIPVMFTTTRHH